MAGTTDDGRRTTDEHTPALRSTQYAGGNPQHATRNTQYVTRKAVVRRPSSVVLALMVITALGLGLRLYCLTCYGIWWDEAYHVALVQLPSVGAMLDAVLSNPPSDPLYVLLLRGWVALFGHDDAAIRLLSVLLSTLTIPATYLLGRVLAGPAVGMLGALLLALSPYAVELGQEAALYVLAGLTTTLALAAGWHWRQTGAGGGLYLALAVVAIYSHYVVAAILAGFALLGLLPTAGPSAVPRRTWLAVHLAIGAAWLVWLVGLAVHWLDSAVPRATLRHMATPDEILGALVQFTSGSAVLLQSRRVPEVAGLLAGAGLLIAGWLAGRTVERRGLRLLAVLGGIIFLAPAAVSAATGLWLFVPHFMIFLLPALFLVLAAGVWTPQWSDLAAIRRPAIVRDRRAWTLALLIVWIGVQAWGLVLFYRYPPHGADGLRDLATTLRRDVRPTDAVLITPPVITPPLRQYFDGPIRGLPFDFDLRTVYPPYDAGTWNPASRAALAALVPGHPRFWLVYRAELDASGSFLRDVRQQYRELEHQQYPFADLYLFASQ